MRHIRRTAAASIAIACFASILAGVPQIASAIGTGNDAKEDALCKRVQTLASTSRTDGGTIRRYALPDGKIAEVPQPPAGFRPENAKPADLEVYGLPAKPADATQAKAWESSMKQWKGSLDPDPCSFIAGVQPSQPLITPTAPPQAAVFSNKIWSGIEANGNTYISVTGSFTMPSWPSGPCANTAETSWVGLGGHYTGKLIQAGTFTPLGWPTSKQYLFYEYLKPGGGVAALSFNPEINPVAGDAITATVTYRASDGNVTFYVADATQGKTGVLNIILGSSYYDGSSAEWVDERPVYGTPTNLKTFTTINWTGASATKSSGAVSNPGSLPHDSFRMEATSNPAQTLASVPSMTTGASWSDVYTYCYGA